MASAADIPAELFDDILFFVCGGSIALWDLTPGSPVWTQAIKTLTACSLTCVYWARICRRTIFSRLRFHGYKDFCTFLSLVSNTPKRFTRASEYAWTATLVQRPEDRPWLHLLQMQPSFFQNMMHTFVDFTIIDSIAQAGTNNSMRRPIHTRLFPGLPRTLPSSCHRCDSLTIRNPYFRSTNDLTLLLNKFSARRPRAYGLQLALDNVSWGNGTRLGSQDVPLMRQPLRTPFRFSYVVVTNSTDSAETAWLAYSCQATTTDQLNVEPSSTDDEPLSLQLQPSAHRIALEVGKVMCQARKMAKFSLVLIVEDQYSFHDHQLLRICHFNAQREDGGCAVNFDLYALRPPAKPPTDSEGETIVIDHITIISVFVEFPSGRPLSPDGSLVGMQEVIEYRWEDIVDLCASLEDFMSLQLSFPRRDDLVEFMEARRAALVKLGDRVALFHETADGITRAVDFTTLRDKGEALEHGHVAWWY